MRWFRLPPGIGALGGFFRFALVRYLSGLVIVLILSTVLWFGLRYYGGPTQLRVAVGPEAGIDARMVEALDRSLATRKAGIRLKAVITSGLDSPQ